MTATRNHIRDLERAEPPVAARPDIACRPADTPLFYADDDERTGAQRTRARRKAEALCARCPHRDDCLSWALESRQQYGIWGGLTPYARDKLLDALELSTPTAS